MNPASAPFLLGLRPGLRTLNSPEDFQRAMAQPWLAKTPHFALHHLLGSPARPKGAPRSQGLSSAPPSAQAQPVDNSFENPVDKCLDKLAQAAWAGYVVPKRHARRAVTRNLIRRQMRQALIEQQGGGAGLPPGIWVLRLRQGFDRAQYPSAASAPLKAAVRDELARLLDHALRRHTQAGVRP